MTGEAAVSASGTATLAVDVGWVRWQIYNNGAATVYYGYDSSVTTSTGTPIAPGGVADDMKQYANSPAPTVYVITASGTADCRVLVVTPAAYQS